MGEQLTGMGWAGLAVIGAALAILALAPTKHAEPVTLPRDLVPV